MVRSIYPLHRSDIEADLIQGDLALGRLMQASSRFVAAGTPILAEQEDHRFVYRLRSGWCARGRNLRDGRAQIVAILLPGDLFGVQTMFLTQEIDQTFALGDVVVDYVDRDELREAAARDPRLTLRLSWQIIEDERRLNNWMIAMGCGSAEERLALLLLDLRGRLELSGAIEPGATAFALPMTQERIGEALGLTSVHVNRTAKRLRALGLATLSRGKAELHDLPGLNRLAYPMLDVFERGRPEYGSRGVPAHPVPA